MRIEVQVPASWERIEDIRQGVRGFARAVLGEGAVEYALSMATAELLENAVKYGDNVGGVRALISDRDAAFVVEVTSAIRDVADADRLFHRVKWLRAFSDPADAYRAMLEELATHVGHVGGIGLARIGYEADCSIDAYKASGKITVTATRRKRAGSKDSARP